MTNLKKKYSRITLQESFSVRIASLTRFRGTSNKRKPKDRCTRCPLLDPDVFGEYEVRNYEQKNLPNTVRKPVGFNSGRAPSSDSPPAGQNMIENCQRSRVQLEKEDSVLFRYSPEASSYCPDRDSLSSSVQVLGESSINRCASERQRNLSRSKCGRTHPVMFQYAPYGLKPSTRKNLESGAPQVYWQTWTEEERKLIKRKNGVTKSKPNEEEVIFRYISAS